MDGYLLIVEDDASIRETVAMVLHEYANAKTVTVPDVDGAMHAIDQLGAPRVAILDFYLNGGTCEVFAAWLCDVYPNTAILVMSAGRNPGELGARCKANYSMKKPFNIEELTNAVHGLLADQERQVYDNQRLSH